MILARALRIEAQVKLIVPTEFEPGLRQRVVPDLRTRPSFRQIGRMRGDFVTDDSRTNILFIRKAEVLFGCHIAQHRRSIPPDLGSAYCTGDVIVTGCDIGNKWTQSIEGRLETVPELFVCVLPDALHRDMPRPSIITCTSCFQARAVNAPSVRNSANCASSLAS